MSSPIKLLFVLASFALVNSLDVELSSVECDPDLPVTADIVLNCDGSSRCTFGEAAGINGTSKSIKAKAAPLQLVKRCSLTFFLLVPISSVLQRRLQYRYCE
jgi:hypothetical protein